MSVRGVHHVAIVVRPENLDAVAAKWAAVLGVEFDEFSDEETGLRVFAALEAGFELIAPLGPTGRYGPFYTRWLEEHGEGLQTVVFNVDDLGAAEERAEAGGCSLLPLVELKGHEPFAHRYDHYVERPLTPIGGINLCVADIRVKPPEAL